MSDDKYKAVLHARVLVDNILAEQRTWVCRYCGAPTWILSEICSSCDKEDCNQGN